MLVNGIDVKCHVIFLSRPSNPNLTTDNMNDKDDKEQSLINHSSSLIAGYTVGLMS